jgi:aminomethyltransferase
MLPVDLHGTGVRPFLRWAFANNVDKLTTPGKALYTCLLNPDGGVVDDLIVYYLREDWFRIVVNAGTADKDVAWLQSLQKESGIDVEIRPRRDLAIIAVQGPNARAKVWDVLPDAKVPSENLKPFSSVLYEDRKFGTVMVCRTGYTGEDGFELILDAEHAPRLWQRLAGAGVRPCGLGARDTLRLEAGMNLYGQDMDDHISPLDAGLGWTVDLKDEARDFVGRAALIVKPASRVVLGLILEDKGVLRAHMPVFTAQGEGQTTSGGFAPSLEKSIAFARLPLGVEPGVRVEVDIRGRRLKARTVRLPFVRNGKALV